MGAEYPEDEAECTYADVEFVGKERLRAGFLAHKGKGKTELTYVSITGFRKVEENEDFEYSDV